MWWQLLAAAVGIWLMVLPAVVGVPELVDNGLRILGPLAVSVGGIAAAQVTRGVRWANVPVGAGVAILPILGGASLVAIGLCVASAAALVGLAFLGGRTSTNLGGGWRSLLQ
jgi:hypothetical protein